VTSAQPRPRKPGGVRVSPQFSNDKDEERGARIFMNKWQTVRLGGMDRQLFITWMKK